MEQLNLFNYDITEESLKNTHKEYIALKKIVNILDKKETKQEIKSFVKKYNDNDAFNKILNDIKLIDALTTIIELSFNDETARYIIDNTILYYETCFLLYKLETKLKAINENYYNSFVSYLYEQKETLRLSLSKLYKNIKETETDENKKNKDQENILNFCSIIYKFYISYNELNGIIEREERTDAKTTETIKTTNNFIANAFSKDFTLLGKINIADAVNQYNDAFNSSNNTMHTLIGTNKLETTIQQEKTNDFKIISMSYTDTINNRNYDNVSKIWTCFLDELNKTSILKQKTQNKFISLTFKELVKKGLYSNEDIARKDLKHYTIFFRHLGFETYENETDYKNRDAEKSSSLFTNVDIQDAAIYFFLNTNVNPKSKKPYIEWNSYFANQYKITKDFKYQLRGYSWILNEYITTTARENYFNVIKYGYMILKIDTIRVKAFSIPITEKTRLRDIKSDIVNAVSSLNILSTANDTFSLQLIDARTKDEFIDNNAKAFFDYCVLHIIFTPSYIKELNDVSKRKPKKTITERIKENPQIFTDYVNKENLNEEQQKIKDKKESLKKAVIDKAVNDAF